MRLKDKITTSSQQQNSKVILEHLHEDFSQAKKKGANVMLSKYQC